MSRYFSLFTVAFFVGCSASEPENPAIPFDFDASGLQLLDRTQRVDFGRTDHSTISAMNKLLAAQPVSDRVCGELRAVAWPSGATLFFAKDVFRGWRIQDRSAGQTCA